MILLIDNYDSFTYNLAQYIGNFAEVKVLRNDNTATQRTKGNNNTNNDNRFKYQIKLPAGVALKNIKFYKANAYGTSTEAPIDLGNATADYEIGRASCRERV